MNADNICQCRHCLQADHWHSVADADHALVLNAVRQSDHQRAAEHDAAQRRSMDRALFHIESCKRGKP